MPWTDEKDAIKEWAANIDSEEIKEKIFSKKDENADSYWTSCGEGNDIEEYAFETLPELKKLLEQSLAESYMDKLILPIAVTTLKNKSRDKFLVENEKDNSGIPDFVYVF